MNGQNIFSPPFSAQIIPQSGERGKKGVKQSGNVLILGATGVGKTYFACALGVAANHNFYTVKYVRLPDILTEISLVRGDGTYREVMRKYKKVKLLILDKWLLYPLKENEASICWN